MCTTHQLDRFAQRCAYVDELLGHVLGHGEQVVSFPGHLVVPRRILIQFCCLALHAFQGVVNLALVDLKNAELSLKRILSTCHALDLSLERAQRAAVAEDVAIPLGQRTRVRAKRASLALLRDFMAAQ